MTKNAENKVDRVQLRAQLQIGMNKHKHTYHSTKQTPQQNVTYMLFLFIT